MKDRFHHDWYFLLITVTTMVAGLNFIINPDILDDRSAYAFIVNALDDLVFSIPMFVLGLFGIIAFLLGKKQFRTFLLVVFQFIWMILMLAYVWRIFTGYPNTTWVLALCLNAGIFLSALWGDEYAR